MRKAKRTEKAQRRAKLPLDDLRWVPLEIPHGLLAQRTGNRDLAASDLTKLLATRVRSMRRFFGRFRDPSRPDLGRERLEFSFWEEHELQSWGDGLRIGRPKRGVDQPIPAVGIYAWKPDLDKIGLTATPSEQRANDAPTTKRRPGPRADWRLPAAAEMHRIRKEEGRTPTAPELCMFCDKALGGYPDEGEMRALMRVLLGE